MNVLVISTHPDDEVLGCGGTIAYHAYKGDIVSVLVVTRGIPELFPPSQIERTRKELESASAILGVNDISFLDFPAPKLDTVPEFTLADAILNHLKIFKPNVIYLPYRNDLHVDHRRVFSATMVAARPINGLSVLRLLCYETLSETEWGSSLDSGVFVPTVYVDISDFLERKLQAMACYQSQLREFPHPRSLAAIEALARFRGSTVGVMAAEAFMLVREIVQ